MPEVAGVTQELEELDTNAQPRLNIAAVTACLADLFILWQPGQAHVMLTVAV